MTTTLVPVATINERARTQAFDIEAIDWSKGVDRGVPWFPSRHMPLAFTPAWSSLFDDEMRITASQWYALSVAEQFITLEEAFLIPAVEAALGNRRTAHLIDADMREALQTFVDEELKHGEMFRRLLRMCEPEWYARGDRHFYTPGKLNEIVGNALFRAPDVFVAWPWLGLILEEKTIAYYRAYERAVLDGEPVDSLHRAVHRAHFLDESRHVAIEEHLISLFYDRVGPVTQAVAREILVTTLGMYTRPRERSVSCNVVRALGDRYPRLRPHVPEIVEQVMGLRHNREFQRGIYGAEAIPRTFDRLDEHPELAGVARVAPDYATRLAARAA